MTGPDLLNSLFGVLQRFRLYRVALSADIEGMFHQVRVPTADSDALRFLWNGQTYQMLVHIFGAKDSPTCANYALKKTAWDNEDKYSKEAVDTVLRDFYVDDLVKSVDMVSDAVQLTKDVTNMVKEGGFRLHKWVSNSLEVLENIEKTERTIQDLDFAANEPYIHRTLGLKWKIDADSLVFDSRPKDATMTKRGVISVISQIFDPCGYLAPFVVRAKLFAQELWRRGLTWDETFSDDLQKIWQSWLEELDDLHDFKLPRHHLNFSPAAQAIQLHVFSDASESGFGAVAYLRFTYGENKIGCSLLAAKTAVAPIKSSLSIPRLELQGAVMATRLGDTLSKELHIAISATWYWTDSTTVLRYLMNETRRFKSFVANRVSEILETTDTNQWRYIPSKLNPADCCSRGVKAAVLCRDAQWSEGPTFLQLEEDRWPQLKTPSAEVEKDDPDVKSAVSTTIKSSIYHIGTGAGTFTIDPTKLIDPSHVSTWNRLVRKTAWIKRAIRNFTAPVRRFGSQVNQSPSITASEYKEAETEWIRAAQQERFSDEMTNLRDQKPVERRSKIAPLIPFLDDNNCLRVGGRLRKANIPEEAKHQLILPTDHAVTLLLFNHVHRLDAHSGREHLVAAMREEYWPVRARNLAKSTIRNCLLCRLRRLKPVVPRMADLPEYRLSAKSGAFYHTGVDYFGPINVKIRRSTVKRWGCLFTCLSTRAVHLELADSLETDDFILCLRRFIGRRGQPKSIHSDNGTNFRGADNELKRCLQSLNQSKVQEFLSPHGVEWFFNPPASPHMGGAWESLVKSVKRALNVVLPKQ